MTKTNNLVSSFTVQFALSYNFNLILNVSATESLSVKLGLVNSDVSVLNVSIPSTTFRTSHCVRDIPKGLVERLTH